ncbi:MAG: hypothetical protein U5K56_17045 [Halioglobus sp.]|nr:hypothetical protein [Halioglobus sp.]
MKPIRMKSNATAPTIKNALKLIRIATIRVQPNASRSTPIQRHTAPEHAQQAIKEEDQDDKAHNAGLYADL